MWGYGHMGGLGYGFGLGFIFQILFWIIVIWLVISLVRYHKDGGQDRKEDGAMEILKKRYAKGEITKEEFEKMKKDLE